MNRYIVKFIFTLIVAVSVIAALTYIGPEKIIGIFGINNIYLAVFIFAIVGGVSAFSAAGFYSFLFSLAMGGANPLILAAFSAPGVLIGDFIFWYVGVESRKIIGSEYDHSLERFSLWLEKKPKWFTPVVIYAYTGFTPFPGDFLMLTLAFLKYKFKQVWIPTLLGNYTLALIVSLSAIWGFS